MGHRSAAEARAYAREYRRRVKAGLITPVPQHTKREQATIPCAACGTSFYRPLANRTDRGTNLYCGRECMARAFCGRPSQRKGEQVSRPCNACSQPVTRPAWWAKQNPNFYCDRKCFARWKAANWKGEKNPAWAGGAEYYYGPTWTRQARRARARDGKQCQFCGTTESHVRNLDVHHIKPFKFFGAAYSEANQLANLVTLCATCHCFLEKISRSGDVTNWAELLRLGVSRLSLSPRKGRLARAADRHAGPAQQSNPQGS